MQLGSCIAVAVVEAGSYSFDSAPSVGTSICSGCSLKKKKKKKKEKRKGKKGRKKRKMRDQQQCSDRIEEASPVLTKTWR